MKAESIWVLVPLKNLDRAKERLAKVFEPRERRELVRAMARDVLAALLAVPFSPERIVLVADDPEAGALALEAGVALFQPSPATRDPLNAALSEATRDLLQRGAQHVLVLHADLPCATAAELRALIAAHGRQLEIGATGRVTLVSDRAGRGTNCLLVSPPAVLAYHFGMDSRRLHREAAASAGVAFDEFSAVGLRRDIDLPAELAELVTDSQRTQNGCGLHTTRLLSQLYP